MKNCKKAPFWISVAAALAGAVAAVCLLTVPKTGKPAGVELLAENAKGELAYYKILTDGTLRQKPDAPGGGYGGVSADADCFAYREENGGTEAYVVKTELLFSDGSPAPVTEERKAVFLAVAAASDRAIRRMEIFDVPAYRTFVSVEYDADGGTSTTVFRFDPENGSLKELCSGSDLRVLDVYVPGDRLMP